MKKVVSALQNIAMVIAFVGIIAFILDFSYGWLILAVAAFVLFMVRLFIRARLTNKNDMRLMSILMFGAVLLLGASYLMYVGKHYWVIPLLIDALVELYVSFRLK